MQDDAVTDKLAQYAIQGVEFTYLRVADIAMNNELVDGQRQVGVLYGFAEGTVLQAIGLTAADAHKSENGTRYYTADKLNKAMSDALTANWSRGSIWWWRPVYRRMSPALAIRSLSLCL